jgi:hypothetical protein
MRLWCEIMSETAEDREALMMKPLYTLRTIAALGAFVVFLWMPPRSVPARG